MECKVYQCSVCAQQRLNITTPPHQKRVWPTHQGGVAYSSGVWSTHQGPWGSTPAQAGEQHSGDHSFAWVGVAHPVAEQESDQSYESAPLVPAMKGKVQIRHAVDRGIN